MDRVIVVGDVHGDLNQLIYPLLYFMRNIDKCKKIIYLGDYIDRGDSTVFIYEIIKSLLECKEMKDRIVFLKGNHEVFEGSVYDYMSTDVEELNKTESTIKSFMLDKFMDLKLNIVHYDKESNILYSHAPLSRNLEAILQQKDNLDLTFSEDRENSSMTYRNIHGHIHKFSSDEDISRFMSGEKKMISLDGDASYGIRMITNSYKKTNRWIEYVCSNVKYLIMYDNGKFEVKDDVINYHSERDLNTKPFNYVKAILATNSENIKPLLRCFSMLNLNESLSKFKSEYLKLFGWDKRFKSILLNLRDLYKMNLRKKKSVNVYFNDVPMELYQYFGLFKPMYYTPTYKLYWFHVLNFSEEGEGKNILRRYKIKEDEQTKFNALIMIVAILVILSIVTYAVSNSLINGKVMVRTQKNVV